MTNSAPALTAPITYQVPDSAVEIVLHYTDTGLPRVETREVGRVVEEWTCTYATEAEARAAARHAAEVFKTFKTVAVVEHRAVQLRWIVAEQIRRMPRGMADRKALAAAETELASIADLNELAAAVRCLEAA